MKLKRLKSKLTRWPLLALLFLGLSSSASAWRESHGGDSVAAEFTGVMSKNLSSLRVLTTSSAPAHLRIDEKLVAELEHAISKARVVTKPKLILRGFEVDAINYPKEKPPIIEVSRHRWAGRVSSSLETRRLVLHEYLFIAGYDDTGYRVSQSLIEKLQTYAALGFSPDQMFLEGVKTCDSFQIADALRIGADPLLKVWSLEYAVSNLVARGCWDAARAAIEFGGEAVKNEDLNLAAYAIYWAKSGGEKEAAEAGAFLRELEARGFNLNQNVPSFLAMEWIDQAPFKPLHLAFLDAKNPHLISLVISLGSLDRAERTGSSRTAAQLLGASGDGALICATMTSENLKFWSAAELKAVGSPGTELEFAL